MTSGRACLACHAALPAPFLDLGSTPLANAYVKPSDAHLADPVFPLAVTYCATCHLVQLTDTVAPEDLFTHYLYFSSYSDSFLAHAEAMAADLCRAFSLGADSRVLEIASNDGYLLQYFQAQGVRVLGVEPAENIAAVAIAKGIPTLPIFFGPSTANEILAGFGSVDVLIGNNVLAHVPDVVAFLREARACLARDGIAVFEFPYVGDLVDQMAFDTIYHEHVFYFSLTAVQHLATSAGLSVFDVAHQTVHGGSLRVFLQAGGTRDASSRVSALIGQERRLGIDTAAYYETFSTRVSGLKHELVKHLGGLRAEGKRLAAYGAPAKGNTLLNTCGIGTDLLEFTVDRSPHKQGLLLPGSRLPILPPEELLRRRPDVTLILPWNIAPEIAEQQAGYRRAGGRFLIPVPTVAELRA